MYKFLKADKGYINNAVERNDKIQWDCNDNTISFYIIVKAPFGDIIDFEDESVQKKFIDQYTALGEREKYHVPDVGDVFVLNGTKSLNITQESATYSIFACRDSGNGDRIIYYYPKNGRKIEALKSIYKFCVDRLRVINIKREMCKKKLFGYDAVVKINISPIENYKNGTLYYTVSGRKTKYPITNELLGRDFFIQCEKAEQIEFFSVDNTLRCVID